ncbi:long-chain-fatty-acid--CoA ligase [Sphingobium sp. CR2-8]|uniref:long-chain-fatty-acid--CoA ligase n=1 Tax=Sphingobium sp. CR2-8 TaxID=1306534 RepID=UPI002DB58231|nr:long-chain-fatty-acid--CoA ligase [Sphingobium sp. CR2-8]MEC3909216.1 long-chain-fatty-acid--CoA ligase [Sphingobium sp. CR2-8]
MPVKFADQAENAYRYPLLISQLLSRVDQHGDRHIVSEGQTFSYHDLQARVGRLANALSGMGIEPGMTVAVMNWDDHRYLECYFAIPMMGAVLQTVNVRLSPQQILYTMRHSGAVALIYHPDFADLVDILRPDLPDLRIVVPIAENGSAPSYDALLAAQDQTFDFQDFDENAIATTFHTTGTTGDPKAVAFSHRQIVLHTLAFATALANQPDGQAFRADDVYMPMTPMFHVHAWGLPYVATLLGAQQIYPSRYDPVRLVALQREHGVTFSHCVPTILQMILDQLQGTPVKTPWTMVIGGSSLPATLADRAARHNIHAIAGYGMSETGPVISLARSGNATVEDGASRAGFPIPLVQVQLRGDTTAELEVRAPWLTQGYVGNDAASAELWHGGWLHTQDIAEQDVDGAIRIVDRLKDVIKTGGEWVSSAVLEDYTIRHPAIAEAAFVGVPDDQWGERPFGAIVLRPNQPAVSLDDIRTHLRPFCEAGHLSRYALPDGILIVAALPKTSVGKIDKKALRKQIGETRSAAITPAT